MYYLTSEQNSVEADAFHSHLMAKYNTQKTEYSTLYIMMKIKQIPQADFLPVSTCYNWCRRNV